MRVTITNKNLIGRAGFDGDEEHDSILYVLPTDKEHITGEFDTEYEGTQLNEDEGRFILTCE